MLTFFMMVRTLYKTMLVYCDALLAFTTKSPLIASCEPGMSFNAREFTTTDPKLMGPAMENSPDALRVPTASKLPMTTVLMVVNWVLKVFPIWMLVPTLKPVGVVVANDSVRNFK